MDVLSDIFETIQLRGTFYFRTDFSGSWGTTVPDHGNATRFHFVVEGRCHVTLPSGTAVTLNPGDLILISGGARHVLRHAPEGDAPPLETVLRQAGYNGEGFLAIGTGDPAAATRMICGHLSFATGADHPLLRALPDHVVIPPAMRARLPWLDETLRLLVRHVFSSHTGAVAAVTRLSEVVFIEAVRSAIEQSQALSRILHAFAEPRIGRTLQLMHARPAEPWTVESLATTVGMSRSRFASQFEELVGCGPIHYLSEWRLQRALALLPRSSASVGAIARELGYSSTAVLTRSFTQKFGRPPTAMRAADFTGPHDGGEEASPSC